MPRTNAYKGDMSREEALEKLAGLARRSGIKPSDIKLRRGTGNEMRLAFGFATASIDRTCDSQESLEGNLACLVLWLNDLVIQVERGIETFNEAFYNEGAKLLPAGATRHFKTTPYNGTKTIEDSLVVVERSLHRLGLSREDAKVRWADDGGESAVIRIRLASGRLVEKVSTRQDDARRNVAALALWLQVRAKNYERGIEREMERLFAANLLPAAGATR